jgi:hypothetical protein
VVPRGDGSFEIRYVIALANRRPDGAALPIRVRGETAERAVADSSLTYALDNTPPPAPVLEPLPATVTAPAVEVRGTAAGAAAALVELDGRAAGDAAVGAGGAFSLGLELSAGSHSVAVRARDAAGNVGPPATASIELLAGLVVRAPRPFRPGSSFLVAPGRAAERVEIRVFNLAAEEVAYLDAAGPADRFEIPWRAVNDDGHEVRSGAFLCRVRLDFAGGESQVHHLPIVVVR